MSPRLSPEARVILQRAVAAGGSYSIHGLALRELARAANLVLELQRHRLVKSIPFGAQHDNLIISVEVTDLGRQAVAGEE